MSFLSTWFFGVLGLSFWQMAAVSVVAFMVSMMSISLYLHRDQAHRSIELHPVLRHFFRFWLWVNSGAHTDEWVAVHRKHHAMCEREGDPHSPRVFGIRKVLLEGAELYKAEAAKPEVVAKYSRGTPRDWMELNVYKRFPNGGIWLLIALSLVLFGAAGIIFLGIQLISMPVFAAGIINGLGHWSGYRNFESDDTATNLVPWAFVIGGEELHNNHHAFPTSAKFSVQPWEFDIGWMYITVFSALGLCEVRRVAPQPRIAETSRPVDVQTLQAVLVNRMHVLRDYTRNVTLPEWKRMKVSSQSDKLLQKARACLVRRPDRLDAEARAKLGHVLEHNQRLRTVHELRERLACIWEGKNASTNVSNEKLVEQLKDWCAEAETSGIQALEEFATRLRGYMPQPALNSA